MSKLLLLLPVAGLLAGCSKDGAEPAAEPPETPGASAPAGPPPDPASYGSIRGVVRFDGPVPANPVEGIGAAPGCAAHLPGGKYTREWYQVQDGHMANVLVYIQRGLPAGLSYEPAPQAAQLNQENCVYVPHVQGLRVGQTLELNSSDGEGHNINIHSQLRQDFNRNMPPQQKGLTHVFERAEVPILVTCDVHPWMTAYLGVFDHPYFAVTGADGSFEWKDVPPGEYTLRAWHEKLGRQEQKLTLEPNGSAQVEFVYRAQD